MSRHRPAKLLIIWQEVASLLASLLEGLAVSIQNPTRRMCGQAMTYAQQQHLEVKVFTAGSEGHDLLRFCKQVRRRLLVAWQGHLRNTALSEHGRRLWLAILLDSLVRRVGSQVSGR